MYNNMKITKYPPGRTDHTYIMPEFIEDMDIGSFNNCAYLTNIVLSKNFRRIYNGSNTHISVFSSCPKLESINVDPVNTTFTSIDGNLFSSSQLIRCAPANPNTTLTIPVSVTSFRTGALSDCATITTIRLLGTVPPTIQSTTFSGCFNLTTIIVPKGYLETYQTATNWSTKASIMVEDEE
jgi:hypothetical protein